MSKQELCPTCKQPLPEPPEEFGNIDVMIGIKGNSRSFHCDNPVGYPVAVCGCNVFRKSRTIPHHYKCNACGATFAGEPAKEAELERAKQASSAD